jgi:hypothetical protein
MKSHFLFLLVLVLFESCTKSVQQGILVKPSGCDSVAFSFVNDVKPLIEQNCSGPTCHSGGNFNYDYSTYAVVADRVRSGRFEERLLLPADDPLHMPQGGSLSACDLFTIRMWIHQGFKNN